MTAWQWAERLKSLGFLGECTLHADLAPWTTYKIGGPADVLVVPKGAADLQALSQALSEHPMPMTLLGKGSNTLVSDRGVRGVVVRTAQVDHSITVIGPSRLRVGASVSMTTLLRRAAQEGWGGLELWAGIPGSVGGAVCMNAGTSLGWSSQVLRQIEVWNVSQGQSEWRPVDASQFSYRAQSVVHASEVVLAVVLEFTSVDPQELKQRLQAYLAKRAASQPIEQPSCGSVFRNPEGHPRFQHAWQVIEALGLRGAVRGGAQISPKHPNFIVNLGNATAKDVWSWVEEIRTRAAAELGVVMQTEVVRVGEWESVPAVTQTDRNPEPTSDRS